MSAADRRTGDDRRAAASQTWWPGKSVAWLLIFSLLCVPVLVVVDIVQGGDRADRLSDIETVLGKIRDLQGDVADAQDETLRNRDQGQRNRRVSLCFARAELTGDVEPSVEYLVRVCLVTEEEAQFILGLRDDLPPPAEAAPATTTNTTEE